MAKLSSTSSWTISSSNSDGMTMAPAPAAASRSAVSRVAVSGPAEATIGELSSSPR